MLLALAAALSLAVVSAAIADEDPHILEDKRECYFGSHYALHHAVFHGDLADVKRMLAGGSAPNLPSIRLIIRGSNFKDSECTDISALELALRKRHIDIFKVLLAAGAEVNGSGGNLLQLAVRKRPEFVGVLLTLGVDPNTALMSAAANRRTESIKLLLAAGANPNIKNYKGRTALMEASGHGRTEIVKILLAAGANPNDRNELGKTALIYAKLQGNPEIISLLEDAMVKKDAEEKAIATKREAEEKAAAVRRQTALEAKAAWRQAAAKAAAKEKEAAERRKKHIFIASVIGGSIFFLAAVVAVVYFLRRRKQSREAK